MLGKRLFLVFILFCSLTTILPDNKKYDIIYRLGEKAYREKKYLKAIQNFTECLNMKPLDIKLNKKLTLAYFKNKQMEKSIYHAKKLVYLERKDEEEVIKYFFFIAKAYHNTKKYKESNVFIDKYYHKRKKLGYSSFSYKLFLYEIKNLLYLNEIEKASSLLKKAKEFLNGKLRRKKSNLAKNKIQEQIDDLEVFEKELDFRYYLANGRYFINQKDFLSAKASLTKCLSYKKTYDTLLYFELMRLYKNLKKYPVAKFYLKKYLESEKEYNFLGHDKLINVILNYNDEIIQGTSIYSKVKLLRDKIVKANLKKIREQQLFKKQKAKEKWLKENVVTKKELNKILEKVKKTKAKTDTTSDTTTKPKEKKNTKNDDDGENEGTFEPIKLETPLMLRISIATVFFIVLCIFMANDDFGPKFKAYTTILSFFYTFFVGVMFVTFRFSFLEFIEGDILIALVFIIPLASTILTYLNNKSLKQEEVQINKEVSKDEDNKKNEAQKQANIFEEADKQIDEERGFIATKPDNMDTGLYWVKVSKELAKKSKEYKQRGERIQRERGLLKPPPTTSNKPNQTEETSYDIASALEDSGTYDESGLDSNMQISLDLNSQIFSEDQSLLESSISKKDEVILEKNEISNDGVFVLDPEALDSLEDDNESIKSQPVVCETIDGVKIPKNILGDSSDEEGESSLLEIETVEDDSQALTPLDLSGSEDSFDLESFDSQDGIDTVILPEEEFERFKKAKLKLKDVLSKRITFSENNDRMFYTYNEDFFNDDETKPKEDICILADEHEGQSLVLAKPDPKKFYARVEVNSEGKDLLLLNKVYMEMFLYIPEEKIVDYYEIMKDDTVTNYFIDDIDNPFLILMVIIHFPTTFIDFPIPIKFKKNYYLTLEEFSKYEEYIYQNKFKVFLRNTDDKGHIFKKEYDAGKHIFYKGKISEIAIKKDSFDECLKIMSIRNSDKKRFNFKANYSIDHNILLNDDVFYEVFITMSLNELNFLRHLLTHPNINLYKIEGKRNLILHYNSYNDIAEWLPDKRERAVVVYLGESYKKCLSDIQNGRLGSITKESNI